MFSMWAPVSNRKPPPEIAGSWRQVPVVPVAQSCQASRVDVEDRPEARRSGAAATPRGPAARGCPGTRRRAAARSGRASRSGRVASVGRHDHRLLEEDVEAGLEAGRRLGEVEDVRGDDEDRVEPIGIGRDEPLPIRLVRRDRQPSSGRRARAAVAVAPPATARRRRRPRCRSRSSIPCSRWKRAIDPDTDEPDPGPRLPGQWAHPPMDRRARLPFMSAE